MVILDSIRCISAAVFLTLPVASSLRADDFVGDHDDDPDWELGRNSSLLYHATPMLAETLEFDLRWIISIFLHF